MQIHIKEAEPKDIEAITELSSQLGYKITNEETQTRLNELLANKDNCVFVAVDNEKAIGWIHGFYAIRLESAPFIEIGGMVVDITYRRMGIGKLLVEKVIEWSASKKCNKIRVRTNVIRKDTHEFYKGLGFKESKEQKIFDRII